MAENEKRSRKQRSIRRLYAERVTVRTHLPWMDLCLTKKRQAPDSACLVSGGGGPALIERLDLPCRFVENLVLEGLARIGAS